MKKEYQILRAYLEAQIGGSMDENLFKGFEKTMTLEYMDEDEAEQMRSVTISEGTDGTVHAKHFSLLNVDRLNFQDLIDFLLHEAAWLTATMDYRVKIGLTLCQLAHSFLPKLKINFNETDSKILLAVFPLRHQLFSPEDVRKSYLDQFGTTVGKEQVLRSLHYFIDLKFVRQDGDRFETRQSMQYHRD